MALNYSLAGGYKKIDAVKTKRGKDTSLETVWDLKLFLHIVPGHEAQSRLILLVFNNYHLPNIGWKIKTITEEEKVRVVNDVLLVLEKYPFQVFKSHKNMTLLFLYDGK